MASSPSPNRNPAPNPIARASLSNAIAALLKWIKSQSSHQKAQLFEHDDLLYLILTLAKIPNKARTNPYRIPIPHPLHPFNPQSTSICIILDDSPSSPLLPAAALDQIRALTLPISSVIGLSELQSDYKPFESRRKLCDSYDLFFSDRKVLPLLPRLLGKHFFKRKKTPLAVDFSRVGWVEQIKSWCGSSLLYLRSGSCSGLKIGRMNQSLDEIVENAMAAVDGAMEVVPRRWKNLRSVHVKTADSVALPVYQKVPEIGMKIEGVWDEKEGEKKRKREKEKKENKGNTDEDVGVEKRVKKKLKKGEDKKRGKGSEIKGDRLMVSEDEEGSALLNGGEERHSDNQLSENKVKKNKKKKMEVESIVASEGTKERKLKKMRDDVDVALNDELGTKNKARKGGKAKEVKDLGDEDVEEGNVVNELTEKRIKKKKKKVEGCAGMKKSKPKTPRT